MAVKLFLTIGYFRIGWGATSPSEAPEKRVTQIQSDEWKIRHWRIKAINYFN
jgi:hypothetical protein